MRSLLLTIFFYLFATISFGQTISKSDLKHKPKNLDEAVLHLEKIHDDTTKQKIRAMTEDQFIGNSHMGLGMWIRNNWGLWKGSELSKYFNSIGIYHPDDMSGIILTSYYRHLKGQDRELDKQVKYYQGYWKASNEHFYKLKTDTAYQRKNKITQDSFTRVALINKKNEWSPGKKVSGYLEAHCGFLEGFFLRTKVEGTIVEWKDDNLIIKVTKYYDEKEKNRLTKCYSIVEDKLTIPEHEYFRLEK